MLGKIKYSLLILILNIFYGPTNVYAMEQCDTDLSYYSSDEDQCRATNIDSRTDCCNAPLNDDSTCPNNNTGCYIRCDTGQYVFSGECIQCPAGYYCKDGQTKESCQVGYYCPAGVTEQTLCPARYYCPTTSQKVACTKEGAYCPPGSTSEHDCPAGHYCPNPEEIYVCPVGNYCPAGSTGVTPCTGVGYYCESGSITETICPVGYYCETTSQKVACTGAGYYCPSGSTSSSGITCPRGYYCENPSDPKECPGYKNASTYDQEFAQKSYPTNYSTKDITLTSFGPSWQTGLKAKTECRATYTYTNAAGTFSQESVLYNPNTTQYDNLGATGKTYYTQIEPGYYVKDRLSDTYCQNATDPEKTYRFYQNAVLCPAGKYCAGLSSMPTCDSSNDDKYGVYTETDSIGINGIISAGYYSAGGAKSAAPTSKSCVENKDCGPCPGYSDTGAIIPGDLLRNISGLANINNAHYTDGNITLKSASEIGYRTGLQAITDCAISYVYSAPRGTFHIDSVGYGENSKKYDQDTWTINAHFNNGISKSSYMITSDKYYSTVNPGYYLTERYNEKYCNTKTNYKLYRDALPCRAGQYCGGVTAKISCNTGDYQINLGIDGDLDGGYFATCGAKSATPTNDAGCIKPGCYCGYVSAGYYSSGGGTQYSPTGPGTGCLTNYTCGKCDAGKYCPDGSSSSEKDCNAGYYCPNTSDTSARGPQKCPMGTTSESGASAITNCYIKGGSDGTKFCIGNNCFNIPSDFTATTSTN